MSSPGTLTWFAHHEFRLAWRDWLHMATAGRRRRERTVAIAIVLVWLELLVALVLLALFALTRWSRLVTWLVFAPGIGLLSWLLFENAVRLLPATL